MEELEAVFGRGGTGGKQQDWSQTVHKLDNGLKDD